MGAQQKLGHVGQNGRLSAISFNIRNIYVKPCQKTKTITIKLNMRQDMP